MTQALLEARETHRKALLDFVTNLLESDAVDRWQIDDHVRTALQWLRNTIDNALPGADEARLIAFGEAATVASVSTNGVHPG